MDGVRRADRSAFVTIDLRVRRDRHGEGREVIRERRVAAGEARGEAEKVGPVPHPRAARRQHFLDDGHRESGGLRAALDKVGGLAAERREGVRGAAAGPHAPLWRAGGGEERRGAKLDLAGIGIPAPNLDDFGALGKEGVDGGVGRFAVEVNGVPAAFQVVDGGLPLRTGGGDEQQEEGEQEKGRAGEGRGAR